MKTDFVTKQKDERKVTWNIRAYQRGEIQGSERIDITKCESEVHQVKVKWNQIERKKQTLWRANIINEVECEQNRYDVMCTGRLHLEFVDEFVTKVDTTALTAVVSFVISTQAYAPYRFPYGVLVCNVFLREMVTHFFLVLHYTIGSRTNECNWKRCSAFNYFRL